MKKYLRPWNSRYKAILGGAKYIATGYISVGQNTLYLQKFDVVANGGLYSHQYMSNIMAASSEGIRTYNKYSNMGQLSNSFTFLFRFTIICRIFLPELSRQDNIKSSERYLRAFFVKRIILICQSV